MSAHVSRAELGRYCRVDEADGLDELEALAQSAETYLTTAGAVRTERNADSYDLCVKAMALHWYDNPDGGEFAPGLRQQINQLKFYREA